MPGLALLSGLLAVIVVHAILSLLFGTWHSRSLVRQISPRVIADHHFHRWDSKSLSQKKKKKCRKKVEAQLTTLKHKKKTNEEKVSINNSSKRMTCNNVMAQPPTDQPTSSFFFFLSLFLSEWFKSQHGYA
jgi:hypothetical protein